MPGCKVTRARESSDETLFYLSFYKPSGTDTHLNAARAQGQVWFLQKIRMFTYIFEGPDRTIRGWCDVLGNKAALTTQTKHASACHQLVSARLSGFSGTAIMHFWNLVCNDPELNAGN